MGEAWKHRGCEYPVEKENNERKGERGRRKERQWKGIKEGGRERQRQREREREREIGQKSQ